MFYERVATNGTEIFWSHLDTWSAARKQINELRSKHLYAEAGYVFGKAVVEATGGPLPNYYSNGKILPYIIPDILPVIVIPPGVEAGAEIAAGILYGITQREQLEQLGECFYGGDEFLYDIISAYDMIAS